MFYHLRLTMKRSTSKSAANDVIKGSIDWEFRLGGMLVQKRQQPLESSSSPMIKIMVSHGSYYHEINVPSQSTFGHVKRVLTSETGLEPKEQRLLFKGKEKEDEECLHMEGVKDMSKIILLEDPASKERKLEEMQSEDILKACEAVSSIRSEIDKLYPKVVALETTIRGGTKVEDKEFVMLTELLMVQLLKLDSNVGDGEAKVQRRVEVGRVQSYVETIDNLKARNSTAFSNNAANNEVSVITKWEAFDSGVGSLNSPTPFQLSTVITQDWELFE